MYATVDDIGHRGEYWQTGRVNVGAAVAGSGSRPTPAIMGLAPGSVVEGSTDFTLAIDGANFLNGAVVRWNGTNRPTTVSATRLTARITAVDVLLAGSAAVSVVNPEGKPHPPLRSRSPSRSRVSRVSRRTAAAS